MRTNIVIPSEATHSSLDSFEKPPLLVTFDQSFEQKTGPLYSPSGSPLEFEVVGGHANGHYAHKSFIETEFSHGTDAKNTWLKFQGYEYEANPSAIANAIKDARKQAARESARITVYGKVLIFSRAKYN